MNTQLASFTRRLGLLLMLSFAMLFLLGAIPRSRIAHTSGKKELEDTSPTYAPIKIKILTEKEKAFKGTLPNLTFGQNRNGTLPYRFLIPAGYVGWVRVDFDVPGAPELPVEEGYYIFVFPKSGRLQTSSSDIVESRRNQFFYLSEKGKYLLRTGGPLNTRLVQEEFSGPGPGHLPPVPNRYRYIFIGPRDAFEKYRALDTRLRPKELDGYPKVGAQTWLTQEDLEKMIPRQN
jgi:hypothetical protein